MLRLQLNLISKVGPHHLFFSSYYVCTYILADADTCYERQSLLWAPHPPGQFFLRIALQTEALPI